MKDIGVDKDFDVLLDHRQDLALVEGEREFEQFIKSYLTRYFYEEIGTMDQRNAQSRIRLYANRLITDTGRLESIEAIDVSEHDELPNTLNVQIVYITGETFDIEIN